MRYLGAERRISVYTVDNLDLKAVYFLGQKIVFNTIKFAPLLNGYHLNFKV